MTARKTPSVGVPAGRLLELQLETLIPEPYVVTDQITLTPPTRARADKIREAQMLMMAYNAILTDAMGQAGITEDTLNGIIKHISEADRAYKEALMGDGYAAVTAFLATQDAQLATAFERDLVKQFFPNQPVDGKCGTCGHVIDEEAAGKAPASSP